MSIQIGLDGSNVCFGHITWVRIGPHHEGPWILSRRCFLGELLLLTFR
jgi:hypothetical protein